MGDRIGVQLPVREIDLILTNHPGLTQPGHLSVGIRAVWVPAKGQWCSAAGEYRERYGSSLVAGAVWTFE